MTCQNEKIAQNEYPKSPLALKQWFSSETFNNKFDYSGNDLGAAYEKNKTVFKVWAPTAESVVLNLYPRGSDEEEVLDPVYFNTGCPLAEGERGVWSVSISGDLEGIYYTYSVTVCGNTYETCDPYGKACGVNGCRSMVVDLKKTDPDGWQGDRRPENIYDHPVIYELHIKDFSNDSHSGIPEEYRGKYKAFTVDGTSLDGEGKYPTCMAYLKKLGVTYVHLLPSFDFGSVDERGALGESFNWGYDPVNYNVPEGSYATDAKDGHVRIREFKEMVMALHRAGIGVVMDVVYNHTYDRNSAFQKIVPEYYYRMYEDGTYANGSGCGNDTASERVMFRRFMADSVCYWAKEYHIDGFRFDLMGLHDTETMNFIRKRLNELEDGQHILMYGEPWSAAATAWENGAVASVTENVQLLDKDIAIFSDRTRDSIKGSIFEIKEKGYVNGGASDAVLWKKDIESAVCAWCGKGSDGGKMMPLAPSQIISYTSAHDDLTLWDKLVVSVKKKPAFYKKYRDIIQMNKMAAGIIFTCLGTPFILAGEEFGRTKEGCGNSYNLAASLNQLDWQRAKAYDELVSYYRFMIELRRCLPVLACRNENAPSHINFVQTEDAVVGFEIFDAHCEKLWSRAMIYYNPYDEERNACLPEGMWHLLTDGVKKGDIKGLYKVCGSICLLPRSVTVFGSKQYVLKD